MIFLGQSNYRLGEYQILRLCFFLFICGVLFDYIVESQDEFLYNEMFRFYFRYFDLVSFKGGLEKGVFKSFLGILFVVGLRIFELQRYFDYLGVGGMVENRR